MNVTVENLSPCRKLLRVELAAQDVDKAFEDMTAHFVHHAALPGFRPGKAPRRMVEQRFSEAIVKEVRRKLIPEAYRDAVREQHLNVIGYPDIEEIQFGRGQALQFAATVETAPEFELPEYKGLTVKRGIASVSDADVERALNVLREQRAVYADVARPVRDGDFVVVNYTGTCEGRPITELAPAAQGLTEQKNFWVHIAPGSFIPGFGEQLIGAEAGGKRTLTVDFPAEFVAPQLAGRKGVYEVEVVQVKEKALPELNDEFARAYSAENLEKLRAGVRHDLQNELDYKRGRETRNQLISALLAAVTFDLPEGMVHAETRNVVYDLVRENQQRGLSREAIERQKDEIFSLANRSAKDRVKAAFLLRRIAEKEGIKVDQNELAQRIAALAAQNEMRIDQFVKLLQERSGFSEIEEQLLTAKVLDFLEANAKFEDAPAGVNPAPETTAGESSPAPASPL